MQRLPIVLLIVFNRLHDTPFLGILEPVSIRERKERPKIGRRCKNCGKNFETEIEKKKFCSNRCRWQYNQSGGIPLYVIQSMVKDSVLKYTREAMLAALVEFKLVKPEMITREGKFLG